MSQEQLETELENFILKCQGVDNLSESEIIDLFFETLSIGDLVLISMWAK